MEEIINKVSESGLIQMDLAKYKPKIQCVELDIAPQLWEGLILKEKPFRAWIKENDWTAYAGKAVYLTCSADAIVPVWAYMLITSKLLEQNVPSVVGTKLDLEKKLVYEAIYSEETAPYVDGRIIVKGCSDIPEPAYAMATFVSRFQPVAKSIMFGEPCSTVPVYKRKS